MKKIVLLGYMGCGKSVVGELLAKQLQITFYDLDNLIENRLQMSVSEIFQKKGEVYFRKLEHTLFQELLHIEENFVLSLGGGTPCYANNHLFLSNKNIESFYLKASIDILYSRLCLERDKRPIIATLMESELKEYIAKHLFERSYFYNQAKHKVLVDDKTPNDIISEILQLLT